MTEKLYDFSPYLTEFTANVISCEKLENGYAVILDKTAFFPEEGGQYSDTGLIENYEVFDVQIENDKIVHYCKGKVSGFVKGKIDFNKRFRNMQNHTGEHIISGLVHSLFGGENVGFHLGELEVTCDYNIELNDNQLKEIELKANEIIYKNLKVNAFYPKNDEIKNINYRSKSQINEAIRIVEIENTDCCACCAPHVKSTGEIGVIKILSSMRLRGGSRLFIACGIDAYKDYAKKHNEIKSISTLLALKPYECADAVKRLYNTVKELNHNINILNSAVLDLKTETITATNKDIIIFTLQKENKVLRELVNKAKEKSGDICAAFGGNDNDGYSYVVYCSSLDIKELNISINKSLNGTGGGKSPMIQGSVSAKKNEIEVFFTNALFYDF